MIILITGILSGLLHVVLFYTGLVGFTANVVQFGIWTNSMTSQRKTEPSSYTGLSGPTMPVLPSTNQHLILELRVEISTRVLSIVINSFVPSSSAHCNPVLGMA